MTFSVVDQFLPSSPKTPDFFQTKFVSVWSALGLVSKAVFWALFEISLLITLGPHVGHTKYPDFYTLS